MKMQIFIEKNTSISGATPFKPMFFKGQLYTSSVILVGYQVSMQHWLFWLWDCSCQFRFPHVSLLNQELSQSRTLPARDTVTIKKVLDPGCSLCYRMNKLGSSDSSCVPVNKASTNEEA